MATRELISSGSKWEPVIGYSRAVKVGNAIHVSGTTGTGPDGKVVPGDVGAQTKQALANIGAALAKAGAGFEHVVMTRIYTTRIGEWEAIGKAHGEVFGTIRPATVMVEVVKLIDPAMLVEIEAQAVIG